MWLAFSPPAALFLFPHDWHKIKQPKLELELECMVFILWTIRRQKNLIEDCDEIEWRFK